MDSEHWRRGRRLSGDQWGRRGADVREEAWLAGENGWARARARLPIRSAPRGKEGAGRGRAGGSGGRTKDHDAQGGSGRGAGGVGGAEGWRVARRKPGSPPMADGGGELGLAGGGRSRGAMACHARVSWVAVAARRANSDRTARLPPRAMQPYFAATTSASSDRVASAHGPKVPWVENASGRKDPGWSRKFAAYFPRLAASAAAMQS